MTPVATFEKVSFEQYAIDKLGKDYDKSMLQELYDEWQNIPLPKRSTEGAAGYDFYAPYDSKVGDVICTGIRCSINPGWVLLLMPRSGLGFKHGLHLMNTVGVIDEDYYNAENEGHIKARLSAEDPEYQELKAGTRFMQGVLMPYGLATNVDVCMKRKGGFGSTGK